MKNKILLLSIFPCVTLGAHAVGADKSPNIILLMCDDLGWGDVGFNGNKIIRTPNLDALAQEGIVLDYFYSASPVSSPTRASVLTGRNPFRTGVFYANEGILRPEEITIPEMLKLKGYASGHFGKWHLGVLTQTGKDANRGGARHPELLNSPYLHGYDEAFVTESKVPTYDPMYKPEKGSPRFWDNLSASEKKVLYNTAYWDIQGKRVENDLSGDDSRVIMDRVIPFINQAVNNQQPFLSVVWFHTPHLPCVAGPEHRAIYKDMDLKERNYYGCITAMDEQVGRLVKYLKNAGEFENTLILFCSDNGPENNTPGSTTSFKNRKRSLYEGGIRVPSIAVWEGKIPANKRISTPCVTSDYLPTIADILNLPVEQKVDGESMLPFFTKSATKRTKPIVFCSDNQAAIIDGDYKLYYCDGRYELYHISLDEREENNIISEKQKIAKRLQDELENTYNDFRLSFEGMEYGTLSLNKIKQSWKNVFKTKPNVTKTKDK